MTDSYWLKDREGMDVNMLENTLISTDLFICVGTTVQGEIQVLVIGVFPRIMTDRWYGYCIRDKWEEKM